MAKDDLSGKLAVILHADVAGSTQLVQQNEQLAHERIQDAFRRFSKTISKYHGRVQELRGDALLAEFERASDAVTATLSFQSDHRDYLENINDDIQPEIRVGIALGEVVIADSTVTGAGVVLAQRIEQLAEPGGLCITSAIHEALPNRMPFSIESLGEQALKGFEEHVRVYRVQLSTGESVPSPQQKSHRQASPGNRQKMTLIAVVVVLVATAIGYWSQSSLPWEEPASIERMALPLPDKPSIAVLPLVNMSDDASQDYFADGMTEDLITDLSKIPNLFVIARTSSFSYKGQLVKVRQIAKELGVRYVLEGSVRRAGDQVRINAQLIDATTDGHLWAERYDGNLTDIFGLQDEVVKKIVNALAINLGTTQGTGTEGTETDNPAAYDAVLKGWQFYRKRTPQDYANAIVFFEKAVELDPGYSRAYAGLATVYWNLHDYGWEAEIGMSYQALELARKNLALALVQPTAGAYQVSAEMELVLGKKSEALAEIDRALALAPNEASALATRAWILLVSGQAEDAEQDARRAIRLDPAGLWNIDVLARVLFHQERYEESAKHFEHLAEIQPDHESTFRNLAMAYAYLGRIEEAKVAIQTYNTLTSIKRVTEFELSLQGFESYWADQYDYDRAYLKQMLEGLRIAGVSPGIIDKPTEINYRDLVTKSAGTFDVMGAIEISASEAKTLHDRGVVFIDGRGGIYERGCIPGAINLRFSGNFTPENLAEVVGIDDEIVFYCGGLDCQLSPNSSAKALTWGYSRVYYFAGGFPEWRQAGYPVEIP